MVLFGICEKAVHITIGSIVPKRCVRQLSESHIRSLARFVRGRREPRELGKTDREATKVNKSKRTKGAKEVKGTKRLESRRKPREAREPRAKQATRASRCTKPKKTEKGNRETDVANAGKPDNT